MKTRIRILACAIAVAAAGCVAESDTDEAPPERTQRQRDSAIAESNLPGAGAVGRALETSDSAVARAARMDSIRP